MIQKGHRLHRLLCKGEKARQGWQNTLNIASQHLKAMTMHKWPPWWTPGRSIRPPKGSFKHPCWDNMQRVALQTIPTVVTLHEVMKVSPWNNRWLRRNRKALMWHFLWCVCLSAPLVDSNSIHSGSAMLMLLTVVFVGLAAFFIYKFKRCVQTDKKGGCIGFSCTLKSNNQVFFSSSLGKFPGSMFRLRTVMRKNLKWSVQSVRTTTCPRSSSVSFPLQRSSWKRNWRPGAEVYPRHIYYYYYYCYCTTRQ